MERSSKMQPLDDSLVALKTVAISTTAPGLGAVEYLACTIQMLGIFCAVGSSFEGSSLGVICALLGQPMLILIIAAVKVASIDKELL